LRGRGLTLDAIAAAIGLARSTVKRWLRRGTVPTWRKPRRAGILDPYRGDLERRWREGCHNASALWRELRAQGFAGRCGVVGKWAADVRHREKAGDRRSCRPRMPSGRRLARLLMTEPEGLGPDDLRHVEFTRAAAPELAEAADLALAFGPMVRDKDGSRLDAWLEAAATSGLAPFTRSLRQDLAAVRGPQPALEHEPGRGSDQPAEDDQAPDVRPGRVRPAPPARPRRRLTSRLAHQAQLTASLHRKCGRT
jgi:transposase